MKFSRIAALAALLLAFASTGCGPGGGDPKSVVAGFIYRLLNRAEYIVQFEYTGNQHAKAWRYNFGDGRISSDIRQPNPQHDYEEAGAYLVKLTACPGDDFSSEFCGLWEELVTLEEEESGEVSTVRGVQYVIKPYGPPQPESTFGEMPVGPN